MRTIDELFEIYRIPTVIRFNFLINLVENIIRTRKDHSLDEIGTLNFIEETFVYKESGEIPTLILIELDRFIAIHGKKNRQIYSHGILHYMGTVNLKHSLYFIPFTHHRSLELEVIHSRWVDNTKAEFVVFEFIKHRLRVLKTYDLPNQTLYQSEGPIPLDVLDGIIKSVTDPKTYTPTRVPDPKARKDLAEEASSHLPTQCESSILQELLDYIRWLLSIYQMGMFSYRGSEEK